MSPDEDPDNADWTKQAWDLPFPPDPANEEFQAWLKGHGMTFAEFRRLPAWRNYQRAKEKGKA